MSDTNQSDAINATSEDPSGYPTISAEDALNRLQTGKPLERVRVTGLEFSGLIGHRVEIIRVVLDRPRFKNATFADDVRFIGCTLINPRFQGPLVAEKSLQLKSCTVRKLQVFELTCRGNFALDRTEFVGHTKFTSCRFEKDVRCWETRFAHWCEFTKCEFLGTADLRSLHAEDGFTMQQCHFHDDFLFRGATVMKKFDLGKSRFEKLLDLSKAKLHDFVYLEEIEQGPAQRFGFLNAVAERIQLGIDQLEGRLQSEEQRDHVSAMREYGLLKSIFQSLHRFDEEDWALYHFKVNQRQAKPRSWFRPWTKLMQLADFVFLDLGCGYGTNPGRAVVTALLIMLAFAGIYAGGVHHFDIENPPLHWEAADSAANRVLFGLMTTVSVFTSGFGGDQLKTAHGWMLFPLAVEALLGTLLWGLFVVAFSRKVIR
jgi:hypothetical protein